MTPPPLIILTIEDPGCGWHDSNKANKSHRQANRKRKQAWRTAAHQQAQTYLRSHPKHHPLTLYGITYLTHRTRGVRADADNLQPTTKAIRDGLVNAGLLEDDSDNHCKWTEYTRGDTHHCAAITVIIEPL